MLRRGLLDRQGAAIIGDDVMDGDRRNRATLDVIVRWLPSVVGCWKLNVDTAVIVKGRK